MHLFKTPWLQETPRHVAGPYRQSFARRYGRRGECAPRPASVVAITPDMASTRDAGRALLRWMADYDIAA